LSLDITLLQMMKHRKKFQKLVRVVESRALSQQTAIVLNDFKKYFADVTDCEVIPVGGAFSTWFTMVAHPKLAPEQAAIYGQMFKQIAREPDELAEQMLMGRLLETNLAQAISDAMEQYQRGDEIDFNKRVRDLLGNYDNDVQRKVNLPWVPVDESLFDEDLRNDGFQWRWECLQTTCRPLRGGDFVILAGRPDKGKTTALTDLCTDWAAQLDSVYHDKPEKRRIIWLNNEGPGKRILKRIVQSAFGCKTSELVAKQAAGTLWTDYEAVIKGHRTTISVVDIHGFKSWQVEEIFKNFPPGLVVFDMIDNVKFDGEIGNGGQRTDQILETMYQWGRDLAVRFDCPIIATSQISADGDGECFPTLPMLKDSKTGKQGAADLIITIGTSNDPSLEAMRFIGTTKNKLRLEGRPQTPRAQMMMDATGGRYVSA
jgi:replicative DNA helicase